MSGGYEYLPTDPLERLVAALNRLEKRVSELERPTGSQTSRYTLASSGGVADVLNQTGGPTGAVWLDSTNHPRVTFTTATPVTAIVIVSANGTVSNAGASTSSTMWGYVGYNYTGGDAGNTSRCILVGAYGAESNPFGATFQDVVQLEPGTYTFKVAAGWAHNGSNNGNLLNNYAAIAVSVQPANSPS